MASPWTSSIKQFNPVGHTPHAPPPGFSPAFVPPAWPRSVSFGPAALFASMARCAAAARSAAALNQALFVAAQAVTQAVVDDAGNSFDLLDDVSGIADFQRTGFTGSVGNGLCDICMNVMGYVWRDLSSELIKTQQPLGDFIYQGGPASAGQVVLSEAKGSFASGASAATAQSLADNGYTRQVHGHLGAAAGADTIVHGYAVALRATPQIASSPATAFAHIAETDAPVPATGGGPGSSGGGTTSSGDDGTGSATARLALGNYRSVFRLVGAPVVVQAIDAALSGESGTAPEQEEQFDQVDVGGRLYLVVYSGQEWNWWQQPPWRPGGRFFLINEKVAEPFLNELSRRIERREGIEDAPFELPVLPLDLGEGREPPDRAILFRDGLAFGNSWGRVRSRMWSPRSGLH